jgi:Zn-finger nucleic acid-binding protein
MRTVEVGKSHFWECPSCDGMWLDSATLQQICAEREQQAAVIGMPTSAPSPVHIETNFRYVPCPVCRQLMNRVNFARMSGVVVDVCKAHGTWFDRDELRRLVEFIRAGGLDKARARQNAELEAEHERLMAAGNAGIPESMRGQLGSDWEGSRSRYSGVDAIFDFASFIVSLLK